MSMTGSNIRIALASLKATKVRTALTTLGIVIGVASISLVLALGEGAKRAVNQQIGQEAGDIISIRPGKVQRDGSGTITGYDFRAAISTTTLTQRDLETVQKVDGVDSAAPVMLITGSVKGGPRTADESQIMATQPEFDDIQGLELRTGQFIEEDMARDVAVIGNQTAINLFGTDEAIGRQITLRGEPYTVIGVLKPTRSPANINGLNYNHTAFINMDAGRTFNQGIPQIQIISVKAAGGRDTEEVASRIQNALLKNHGGEENFAVIRADEASRLTDEVFGLLISIASAIAAISLVVGGIGIMNIMLVSVTERTREVGIRKAVGATNSQILSQFLIEAMLMCVVGGILGLIAAYVIALLIRMAGLLPFLPALTWPIVGIAFIVSLAVGLIFGLFPAARAARKDPIQALRQLQ